MIRAVLILVLSFSSLIAQQQPLRPSNLDPAPPTATQPAPPPPAASANPATGVEEAPWWRGINYSDPKNLLKLALLVGAVLVARRAFRQMKRTY